jgi:thiamine-phosphate pyrophosphorylase
MLLPRLYPILDAGFAKQSGADLFQMTRALFLGGARFLQYRNKQDSSRIMLADSRELRKIAEGQGITLIMNDRADLCVAAGFDGVHVGQDDLSPEGARRVIGDDGILGISCHNPEQIRLADESLADYIAIGPVFGTQSKANPDPVVGLEGVRAARKLTRKPLVAIGGITRANCASVMDAGADSVAVISDLLQDTQKRTEEFLRILG